MQPDMHPKYRYIVFRDISTNTQFLTRSAADERHFKENTTIDGVEYPVITVDISSDSHPFYTGQQKLMDTEGRVDRYYRKYGFANPNAEEIAAEKAAKAAALAALTDGSGA